MSNETSHERRAFLKGAAGAALAGVVTPRSLSEWRSPGPLAEGQPFLISLAQWSLHRAFKGGQLDALEFAVIAKREYGIDAVEYVNQFYVGRAGDAQYLAQLKQRAEDHGVRNVLIMCDGEGALGDPDEKARATAVDNHRKWLDWARTLGCHSIRVNADSRGEADEQRKRVVDGLRRLTEIAVKDDLNVIVENHGGLSSNGAWLAGVIRAVDHPRCGTLPDFGNFTIGKRSDGTLEQYDRYTGIAELMPFARGVSAKSYDFNERGEETTIDYTRMLKIVMDAGYRRHVGIEYEGERLSEPEGIRATKALLERIRATAAKKAG